MQEYGGAEAVKAEIEDMALEVITDLPEEIEIEELGDLEENFEAEI